MTARSAGAAAFALACLALAQPGITASEQAAAIRPADAFAAPTRLFVATPTRRYATSASTALVDAHASVRAAFAGARGVRLVDRQQDADVVLTLLRHGAGPANLRPMFRSLDADVMAPPILIGRHDRYLGAMLAMGPCGEAATASGRQAPAACFRRVFVGVDTAAHPDSAHPADAARNSWTACARALAEGVEAWLETHTSGGDTPLDHGTHQGR